MDLFDLYLDSLEKFRSNVMKYNKLCFNYHYLNRKMVYYTNTPKHAELQKEQQDINGQIGIIMRELGHYNNTIAWKCNITHIHPLMDYVIKYSYENSESYLINEMEEILEGYSLILHDNIQENVITYSFISEDFIIKLNNTIDKIKKLKQKWQDILSKEQKCRDEEILTRLILRKLQNSGDPINTLTEKINELITKLDSTNITNSRLKYLLELIDKK